MLAVLLALLLICNSTFAACPTGYTETAVTGESNICLQFVYQATAITQSAFNTLCSTNYNGGYLVVQSTVAQRTATNNFAKTGCASTSGCSSGASGERQIWIGVQLSGAGATGSQLVYSPSTGLGWATNTAVTSTFTPGSTTYWVSGEPSGGDVTVRLVISGSGTASSGYSITGWKGIISSQTYTYGIWYDIFTYH